MHSTAVERLSFLGSVQHFISASSCVVPSEESLQVSKIQVPYAQTCPEKSIGGCSIGKISKPPSFRIVLPFYSKVAK